jgi:hypothetical protein
MRALAGKFGAHLAFRDGEAIGTIDLTRQPQAELAKLASAPFVGTRAVMNFSRVYRTLLSAIAASVYRDAKWILLRASGAAFACRGGDRNIVS